MKGPIYVNPRQRIGGGGDSVVYRCGFDLALKVHFLNETAREEYEIMTDLYPRGVSIPQPFDLVNVIFPKAELKGILMKLIDHNWKEYPKEAERMREIEIRKAMQAGYTPEDHCYGPRHNCLWSPQEKKVYLIDFVGWKKIGVTQ